MRKPLEGCNGTFNEGQKDRYIEYLEDKLVGKTIKAKLDEFRIKELKESLKELRHKMKQYFE